MTSTTHSTLEEAFHECKRDGGLGGGNCYGHVVVLLSWRNLLDLIKGRSVRFATEEYCTIIRRVKL